MEERYKYKQASQQEVLLYCCIGEAVCAVQHLEDALSHMIVLKVNAPSSKPGADQLLDKHRKYTLGKAIRIGDEEAIYSDPLQNMLEEFLKERNWLIHKSIAQNREAWDKGESRDNIISRIRAIATQAQDLIQMIESDLITFSEANGKDMSRVKAEIRKYYS